MLDVYDTICLTLAANDHQIQGRTTIQKLICFEMEKIPKIEIEPHIAYFYGPFNKQVARGLETLVNLDIINKKRFYQSDSAYEYTIQENRISLTEKLINENEIAYKKIKDIVQSCQKYCQLDHNLLSLAAKVHYMISKRECKKGITENKAIEMTEKFGWKITKKDVKSGIGLLEKLNLVKIRR